MIVPPHWPVIGICGYSGSGKTTLIERLVPRLVHDGLAVAVIKYDAHGLDVDRPGKDTDRLFHAGATVFAHDSFQSFIRVAGCGDQTLPRALELLLRDHDLVLVEGNKQTALPCEIWLRSPVDGRPPPPAKLFLADLGPEHDRPAVAYRLIDAWLRQAMRQAPLRAGILLGGRSSRMGHPKHLLQRDGKTWIEHQVIALVPAVNSVCFLGDGEVPAAVTGHVQLPDAPDTLGPLAGMTAAMRWDPRADWLFVACDMPFVSTATVDWLLDQRVPGRWAVMPRHHGSGQIEPLFAWYDRRLATAFRDLDRPITLATHCKTALAEIPKEFHRSLINLNAPDELDDVNASPRAN